MNTIINKELEEIISSLTSQLSIEQIFYWNYTRDGKKLKVLQVHLESNNGQMLDRAQRICNKAIEPLEETTVILNYHKDIEKKVDQGLGRLFLNCRRENQVYQNPKSQSPIELPDWPISTIVHRSQAYIDKEIKKIRSYEDGYFFYLVKGNYPQAAFMLHQMFELIFRAAEQLLIGVERRTHLLSEHHNYIKTYDSKFARLFYPQKHKSAIRSKLDEAYSSIRYDQDYTIKSDQLEEAYPWALKGLAYLQVCGEELKAEIEEKLSPEYLRKQKAEQIRERLKVAADGASADRQRELILMALQVYCIPRFVSCFAYRARQQHWVNSMLVEQERKELHHYYLLVVYEKMELSLPEMQSSVNYLLPDNMRVTLLWEEYDQMVKNPQKKPPFYSLALRSDEVWLKKDDEDLLEADRYPVSKIDIEYVDKLWRNRYLKASSLFFQKDYILNEPVYEADCYTIGIAVEQICLGIIHAYMQYQPKWYNLNYLMEVCDALCPQVTEVFMRGTEHGDRMFKLLVETQQKFRYAAGYKIDGESLATITDMVGQFIDLAGDAVSEYLDCFDGAEIRSEAVT